MLGTSAIAITTAGPYYMYDNGSWSGTLDAVENEKMYAINMAEEAEVTLRGSRAAADQTVISLANGWKS